MTDGSPLVSIRKSLARVKAEIVGMDVRVSSIIIMIMIKMMVMIFVMMMMILMKVIRKSLTIMGQGCDYWRGCQGELGHDDHDLDGDDHDHHDNDFDKSERGKK